MDMILIDVGTSSPNIRKRSGEIHKHDWEDEHTGRGLSQDTESVLKDIGLHRGMTVADLGCGSGYFTIPMVSYIGKKGMIYAIDRSQAMLSQLRENIRASGVDPERIKVIEADISHTAIPAQSVDIAFFANVLHDIDDRAGFLDEVKRILKPSGVAVDIDWHKTETMFGPPMKIRLDEVAARKILQENGLKTVRVLSVDRHHYGLVCELSNSTVVFSTHYTGINSEEAVATLQSGELASPEGS